MNSLILIAMGLNTTITLLLEGWLWHYITHEVWYAIEQRNHTTHTHTLSLSVFLFLSLSLSQVIQFLLRYMDHILIFKYSFIFKYLFFSLNYSVIYHDSIRFVYIDISDNILYHTEKKLAFLYL